MLVSFKYFFATRAVLKIGEYSRGVFQASLKAELRYFFGMLLLMKMTQHIDGVNCE